MVAALRPESGNRVTTAEVGPSRFATRIAVRRLGLHGLDRIHQRRRFGSAGFPGLPTYVLGKSVTVPDVAPTQSSFAGPVAVIINGNCFSACESFEETMSRLPQVALVGDTTAGGGGLSPSPQS